MSHFSGLAVTRLSYDVVPVSAKTAWVLLRCELSDGAWGWGEATFFGTEAALAAELAALGAAIRDISPVPVAPALDLLGGRSRNAARDVVRSGFEAALLDAMARRAGVPLATLLGGPARTELRAYANINRGIADRTPDGFARAARTVVGEEGYDAVKIAPFDGYLWYGDADPARLRVGIERVAAVRAALGEGVDILVDCHGRFAPAEAHGVVAALAEHGPFWIEEPLDAARTAPEAQRALRDEAHRRGTRIAGGEEIETMAQALALLAIGGQDVILPDLRQTGIRRGMAILELAVAQGVAASLHNPAGPVLDAVSRHVACALPSCLILERQVRESPLYTAIGGAVPVLRGRVGLGQGPGIGMEPDRAALAAAAGEVAPGRGFRGMAGAGPDA